MKAALYGRVSRKRADRHEPWASMPQQMADLRELARRFDFEVALEVEEHKSGAKHREGWAQVLEAARQGEVQAILAVHFDRTTRSESLSDWETTKAELRAVGCRLITCKEGEIDLSGSADAELYGDFKATLSKHERLKIKERTSRGRQSVAKQGLYYGGPAPFGYGSSYDPATGKKVFHVKDADADVVRRIFQMAADGVRVHAITTTLNNERVPAPGDPALVELGDFWYDTTIRRILANPTYIGVSIYGRLVGKAGEAVESKAFPPIIDETLWQAAQSQLAIWGFRSARGRDKPYPLSGILRCYNCGNKMVASGAMTTPGYKCRAARTITKSPCPQRQFLNQAKTNQAVLDYLMRHLPEAVGGRRHRAKKGTPKATPASLIERKIAQLEKKRRDVLNWIAEERVEEALGFGLIADYAAEMERLKAQLKEVAVTEPPLDEVDWDALRLLMEEIPNFSPDDPDLRDFFEAAVLQVCVVNQAERWKRQEIVVERLQLTNKVWL